MGHVSTEPGKIKCLCTQFDRPNPIGRTAKTSFRSTNAMIAVLCSSYKMNALSTSSITDAMAEYTHLNSPVAAILCCKRIQPKHSLVTWMVTLRL